MLRAYMNYPNAQLTIHKDSNCASVRQRNKDAQRAARLNIATLSIELSKFSGKAYRFGSDAELNDMWLEVDLNDENFERAVVEYVRSLLARHYKPFSDATIRGHC